MNTNMPTSVEEVLIRDLIEAMNPGVEFQLQVGKYGVEEVLVDEVPVLVSTDGVIMHGGYYRLFYASHREYYQTQARIHEKMGIPQEPIFDHLLLNTALQMKNPGIEFSATFSEGKLVNIDCCDMVHLNSDGIIVRNQD